MAHLIMDHGVSGCFGTSLAPNWLCPVLVRSMVVEQDANAIAK
jgi:hypothetical protein